MKADSIRNGRLGYLGVPLAAALLLFFAFLIQHWRPAWPLDRMAKLILIALLIFYTWKLVFTLATWRGRRYLLSLANRLWRWEFWSPWAFYPPVALYYLWLSLRFRSITLPCLANPGLPLGGWFESKAEILPRLSRSFPKHVGAVFVLPPKGSPRERYLAVRAFQKNLKTPWPLVSKPDVGERGREVHILESEDDLRACVTTANHTLVFQQYHAGKEFGVFFIRDPKSGQSSVFSIAEKCPVYVVGDGFTTLEDLILKDSRAVCKAPRFMQRFPQAKTWVPASGERVKLTVLGSHNQGTLFLDRSDHATPELEASLESISSALRGFYFGRFDIKARSLEDLEHGESFHILEVNGITSEPIQIFKPFNSLWSGYSVMFRVWRTAFEIGNFHREQGLRPPKMRELFAMFWRYYFHREQFVLPPPIQQTTSDPRSRHAS